MSTDYTVHRFTEPHRDMYKWVIIMSSITVHWYTKPHADMCINGLS